MPLPAEHSARQAKTPVFIPAALRGSSVKSKAEAEDQTGFSLAHYSGHTPASSMAMTATRRRDEGHVPDPRDPRHVAHSQRSLLRQRIYGISLGYEDLNDHQRLRIDPALQSSIEREAVLGSQSTLCRPENRIDRRVAVAIHKLRLEQFIASHDEPPDELILDFDVTDDPVHGTQEGRFFHGHYDHYCFLPLYVDSRD